jgi:SSS family solute:Na+ symporter
VGLAGTGASSGLAVVHFELLAVFVLIILGYVFAPFYFKTNVYTMPEYLEKRYSRASRFYLSIVV